VSSRLVAAGRNLPTMNEMSVKVLVATAMYPTVANPAWGAFVKTQVDDLKRAGVEVELLVLDGPRRKLNYATGVVELRRRLRDDPSIDLVHAHYSYVGAVARTQRRVPVVVSYHGDDLLGTRDTSGRTRTFSKLVVAGGRWLGQLADAVIVMSEAMAQRLKRPDVHVIPHGVDFDVFRPIPRDEARQALGLDPAMNYVLFAANPGIATKRYPLAAAAVEELRKSEPSVELLVRYTESQARLALHMNACDVLVFPSFQEGSPTLVKQAMACNLPIVASDAGDVRDVIGRTAGCHVCTPTAAAFAEALGDVLRRRERTRGREDIRHLDSRVLTAKVVDVYKETLEQRRSRRGVGGGVATD
jgi:teichuronic acid biosynthesis glycosyltransferase TuaC